SFVTAARAELAAVDPGLPAFDVMRLSDAIRQSLSGSSQIVVMMGILAAVALLIAVVGLYGVVAYLVAARTREFGVRLALAARRVTDVRRPRRGRAGRADCDARRARHRLRRGLKPDGSLDWRRLSADGGDAARQLRSRSAGDAGGPDGGAASGIDRTRSGSA